MQVRRGARQRAEGAAGQRQACACRRADGHGAGAAGRDGIGEGSRHAGAQCRSAAGQRDRAGAERTRVSDGHRAGADGRATRIGVGAGERQRACADLVERTCAGDDAGQRHAESIGADGDSAGQGHGIAERDTVRCSFQLGPVGHGNRARTQRATGAHCDGAGRNRRAARVTVCRQKREGACTALGHGARSADCTGEGDAVDPVEGEHAVVGDIAGDRARRAAIADLQGGAGVDRRAARIGVGAGKDQGSRAGLRQRARAADRPRIGHAVAAVEGERAVVGDIAADRAGGSASAHLQRAGADGRAACVGIGACQDQRAGARLGERTTAGDRAREGEAVAVGVDRVGAGERHGIGEREPACGRLQRGAVGHGERAGAESAVVSDAQGAGIEGNATLEAVRAREHQRAGAVLGERTAAGDRAREGEAVAVGVDRVGAGERHGVGDREPARLCQQPGAVGHGERAAAQSTIVAKCDGAGIERDATLEAVGAEECQCVRAALDE